MIFVGSSQQPVMGYWTAQSLPSDNQNLIG